MLFRSYKKTVFLLLFILSIYIKTEILHAGNSITLRVANWAGAEEVILEKQIAAEFMRMYPEVKVRIEPIPSNYREKILTGIAAGKPPDVLLLDSVIIPALVNKGVLVDLMPYVERYGVDLSIYYPNVLAIALRDSSLYALPKDFTPMVMYYNKRLFDDMGIPYPEDDWTWDDYLEIAKRLTKDRDNDGVIDQFGTAFLNTLYLWQPWVWMMSGDILSPDGTRATGYFNSPETEA
ncbi:MAG: extracellular solute-binding protein, partial [Fidelibacterota bacterium]